ncbi:hypothetical protein [Salinicola lusitanus]|uniref:hypothetical protein n=1 Tax=Salinicola lusitanus TaxID=1949085 RepID=UPI0013900EF6|nr:hypothetical protein [Salinicola lusitanus]
MTDGIEKFAAFDAADFIPLGVRFEENRLGMTAAGASNGIFHDQPSLAWTLVFLIDQMAANPCRHVPGIPARSFRLSMPTSRFHAGIAIEGVQGLYGIEFDVLLSCVKQCLVSP